jgi:hypothetical protein
MREANSAAEQTINKYTDSRSQYQTGRIDDPHHFENSACLDFDAVNRHEQLLLLYSINFGNEYILIIRVYWPNERIPCLLKSRI